VFAACLGREKGREGGSLREKEAREKEKVRKREKMMMMNTS